MQFISNRHGFVTLCYTICEVRWTLFFFLFREWRWSVLKRIRRAVEASHPHRPSVLFSEEWNNGGGRRRKEKTNIAFSQGLYETILNRVKYMESTYQPLFERVSVDTSTYWLLRGRARCQPAYWPFQWGGYERGRVLLQEHMVSTWGSESLQTLSPAGAWHRDCSV